MEIKKLNDLTYTLHFDSSIQTNKLYQYLYKASIYRCNITGEMGCDFCELNNGYSEYWKLIDVLSDIAE